MSTWWSSALVLALVSGCTSLLDLDTPRADRDRDGVSDESDNCPESANAQQLDTDRDGAGNVCDCPRTSGVDEDADGVDDACDDCIGEAKGVDMRGNGIDDGCEVCPGIGRDSDLDGVDDLCDVCPEGPPHDEDGDGLHDACDNCPIRPNPGQETGGSGLGAACDLTTEHTVLFDGFAARDAIVWPAEDAAWRWVNDQLVVGEPGQRAVSTELSETMTVEVRVDAADTAELRCAASVTTTCRIGAGFLTASLQAGVLREELAALPPHDPPVRLRMIVNPATVTCLAIDDDGAEIARVVLNSGFVCQVLALQTTGPAAFDYLYVAREEAR